MKLNSVFYLIYQLGIDSSFSVKKSIIIRFYKNNNYETKSFQRNFFNQNSLLLLRLLKFWLVKTETNFENENAFIVETSSPIPERKVFLKNLNVEAPIEYISGQSSKVNSDVSNKYLFKIWWIFFKTTLYNFLQRDEQQTKYFWPLFNMIIGTPQQKNTKLYVFRPYHLTSYLYALYFSSKTPNVFYISSNTSLFPRRYTHLPKAALILCSKFQIEEVKFFSQYGWMTFKDTIKGVLEEADQFLSLPIFQNQYDIGVYSTGHWARNNGISRVSDIKGLKERKFVNNIHYNNFIRKLNEIIRLKHKINYSVKFYFHPYERKLFKEYGIEPPHLNLLDANEITYDLKSKKSSIQLLNECKVGITQISTIISDRWEINLKGIYYLDEDSSFIDKRYLGKYGENLVYNEEELENRILNLLH